MNDCVFCKIASGEIPGLRIFENKDTLAFMDIAKDVDGHILVIPKKHCKNILDWSYMLASHKLTWENVGVEFFMSEEMRSKNLSNEEYVTSLYQTFMEREPETDGFNYWVSQLNNGVSKQTVVNGFTRSEEFLGL